jgi:deoxyribonuclease-4
MRFLGSHVSSAGGLPRAIERAADLGCTATQIFVKSPNQWKGRPLPEDEVVAFREQWGKSGIGPIVSHAAYLINLCAIDEAILERSRDGLGDELDRSARLGLDGLVVHPGAHMGQGIEAGLELIAASLDAVLDDRDIGRTRLLLEATAGQGTVVGHRLEHLERIIAGSRAQDRLGICLDTCHLFAAGYDVRTADGIDGIVDEVRSRFGLERLGCIHLNDSRFELGAHRDRHVNIGGGEIGAEAFAYLVAHPTVRDVPLILETPLGDDKEGHRRDLQLLRELAIGGESHDNEPTDS